MWMALRPVLHVEPPCFPRDRVLEANSGCAHSRHSHVASYAAVFTRLEHGALRCDATGCPAKSETIREASMRQSPLMAGQ